MPEFTSHLLKAIALAGIRTGSKYFVLSCLLAISSLFANAQRNSRDTVPFVEPSRITTNNRTGGTAFIVGEIEISGNKRTKPYILARELPFKTGDSVYLPDLVNGFEIARQQLINTRLFNEAVVALKSFRGNIVDISITVKERWYIFPLPYLKPIDRNLSEWAKQGYGLDRVNYGFKFNHYNATGRNDKLRLFLITGYSRQIEFQYDQPYADKSLKHGYKLAFQYSQNKELNYNTIDNQQKFVDTFGRGTRRWHGSVEYTYRPGLRTFNGVRLSLTNEQVDPGVLILNPHYFNYGKSSVTYPELSYTLNYFKLDYIPFPLNGWSGEFSFIKRGIHRNMNMWQFGGKLNVNREIARKLYFGWQSQGIIRFPFDQPYINQRMFGYGDFYLRGLEKYVIDGVAGAISKHSLRKELIRFSIPTYLKSKSHDRIPFKIYARTFGDVGYSYLKSSYPNPLNNRMLYTGGAGIDIVTFYDFILRIDYSFNQLGENGLFLHIKGDF
ncbi:MAG: POTRA domain-containing protein [Flavitalea sp.]